VDKVFAGKRILVLEDEKLLLDGYAERLEKAGFIVTKADNPSDALEAICQIAFHLAWVDLTLEGPKSLDRKGYLVIDRLNALNEGTKIVVVTHHSRGDEGVKEARRAFRQAGAHEFIPKSLATRNAWPQCLEMLEQLLIDCPIDKSANVLEAQREMFGNSEEIVIGTIINKFGTQFDGVMLWNSLLLAYNKIKPIRRHKRQAFEWDEKARVFRAQFWSRAIGSSVELIVSAHPTAPSDAVLFDHTKGAPLTIRKTDAPRDQFEE
jgi:CheY-like chemotaxis protein